jgi:hypothetical protein
MREADLTMSRRRFLVTSLKASAGVGVGLIVGPEVFDMLDRIGPRRLMVPGTPYRRQTIDSVLPKILAAGILALRQNAVLPNHALPWGVPSPAQMVRA